MTSKSFLLRLLPMFFLAGVLLLAPDRAAAAAQALVVSGGTSTNISSGTNSYSTVTVGNQDSGNSLTISSGAEVLNSGSSYVGYDHSIQTYSSNNSVLVTGSGSLLSNSANTYVGYTTIAFGGAPASNNSLTISNGGTVIDVSGFVGGTNGCTNNSVVVTGSGSLWSNSSTLSVTNGNSLTVADGGRVVATSLFLGKSKAGILNIGSLGGNDTAGVLSLSSSTITITGPGSTGIINFNQTDTFIFSNTVGSGTPFINQFGSGTTILTAAITTGNGSTMVTNGTLLAENSLGPGTVGTGTLTVTTAGTLGGNGTLGQIATIASGGKLVPGVSGTGSLAFTNGLTLGTGSTTTFLITTTNSFTSINVIGKTVTYGGALDFNITSYANMAQTGDAFTVFNMTNSASESGDFSSVEVGGTSLTDSGGIWSGNYLGGSYQFNNATGKLTVVAAPEPSTYALLGLSLLALMYLRRARRLQ